MSNFIVQFPLVTEIYQEDILNKRFEIARSIYNSLINVTMSRYNEMIKTKKYCEIINKYKDNNVNKKNLNKQLNELRRSYGLSEYDFHSDVKQMQKHFKNNIDSFTAQKIASRLWKSYEKLLFGNGEKIRFKKFGELNSLEGKSNGSGIRFKNGSLIWNGLVIPVLIKGTDYEIEALKNEIAYIRIARKFIKGKYKFYIQIVFKGVAPIKKKFESVGDVGLDIGTQTIAVCSATDVKLLELADKTQDIENQKRIISRKLDRSRRTTNPNNYNIDGTIKKQGNKKVVWNKSNRYIKNQKKLKELYRKQADIRKYQHECMANKILSLGDKIYVEEMSFKGLQRRAKNTEVNAQGKFKRKKRFGKSLSKKAPAMLISIIERKAKKYNKQFGKINTKEAKASQYNHIKDNYKKKKLSNRWNNINGVNIQRDMYSSFLIMNINDDLKSFNKQKCEQRFEDFKKLHDMEVRRLTGNKNLSSMAIK